jgi:hypothetical protein
MSKLAGNTSDVLYEGEWLEIRAMARASGTCPAKEWYQGLEKKGLGQFEAAARIIETTLRAGRPPAGRAEPVKISRQGLWELKVTKPGGTAPHLRLLFRREGRTLWAAVGFTKKKNKLETKDVELGDSVTVEWLKGRVVS